MDRAKKDIIQIAFHPLKFPPLPTMGCELRLPGESKGREFKEEGC